MYNSSMISTRLQIISYLEHHHSASVRELSNLLHLTPANIRHHLAILQKEGSVNISLETTSIPRGRPTKTYSLSSRKLANNYPILCKALLDLIKAQSQSNKQEIYQSIANTILGNEKPSAQTLTQNLIQTINWLNKYNYEANWEAEKEQPIIKLNHCPYYSLVQDYPELCEIDNYLLNRMINRKVLLVFKLQKGNSHQTTCKFKVIS